MNANCTVCGVLVIRRGTRAPSFCSINCKSESQRVRREPVKRPDGSFDIILTRGYRAIVDAADLPIVMQHSWSAAKARNEIRASTLITLSDGRRRKTSMERLLTNAPKGLCADHINGNTLDNRRSNLRIATFAGNSQNRGSLGSSSGYKGVSFFKQNQKFAAKIGAHGKRYFLGYYTDPKDAARAYNEAALRLHGEYARLNEIEEAA